MFTRKGRIVHALDFCENLSRCPRCFLTLSWIGFGTNVRRFAPCGLKLLGARNETSDLVLNDTRHDLESTSEICTARAQNPTQSNIKQQVDADQKVALHRNLFCLPHESVHRVGHTLDVVFKISFPPPLPSRIVEGLKTPSEQPQTAR